MKLIGTVKAYDDAKGFGSIVPEAGGDALRFESSAVQWGRGTSPKAEQRLSYELSKSPEGEARAVNLQSI